MKLTSLANLLSGNLPAAAFSAEIADELLAHTIALQKLGSSAAVVVVEDTDVLLDREGMNLLCRLFASGQISAAELAYTADALQLSERVAFAEASIADHLAEFTDPEVNGPLTAARALELAGTGNAA